MAVLYPSIEPYDHGMLEVGGSDLIYWEVCGNPDGKPALVVHGGPGSGCTAQQRRLFEPAKYRIALFDQRNCGRSRPHASAPQVDLTQNTTDNLVADIESLRKRLDVERWLLLGGSWGSALALAYAERFSERISELILFGVTTGRQEEFDWLFRDGLGLFFPEEWERRRNVVRVVESDRDVVDAYHRLLNDPDAQVRERAALAWCLWESATPDWPPTPGLAPRFSDPSFRLAFARIVTHYVRENAWLGDGRILRDLERVVQIPAILIDGRFDFQSPLATAWELHRRWPMSELVIVDSAGHAAKNAGITQQILLATDRYSQR